MSLSHQQIPSAIFNILKRNKLAVTLIIVNCLFWWQALSYLNSNIQILAHSAELITHRNFDGPINSDDVINELTNASETITHASEVFSIEPWTNVLVPIATGSFATYFPLHNEYSEVSRRLKYIDNELSVLSEVLNNLVLIANSAQDSYKDWGNGIYHNGVPPIRSDLTMFSDSIESLEKSILDQTQIEARSALWAFSPLNGLWIDYHSRGLKYVGLVSIGSDIFRDTLLVIENVYRIQNRLDKFNQSQFDGEDIKVVLKELSGTNETIEAIKFNLARLENSDTVLRDFDNEFEFLHDLMNLSGHSLNNSILLGEVVMNSLNSTEMDDDVVIDLFDARTWPIVTASIGENQTELILNLDRLNEAHKDLAQHESVLRRYGVWEKFIQFEEIISIVRRGYKLAPIMSDIMAEGGNKTYIVLAHSSDELRGTGGFISGIWTVELNDFSLEGIDYYDVLAVDNMSKMDEYPEPPSLLKEYMGAGKWFMRDVSWDPSFRSSSGTAQDMFAISNGISTQGAVGINQWALVNIIQALGTVHIAEMTHDINAQDVITVLEKNTDKLGREYGDTIFRSILRDIQSTSDFGTLWSLTRSINKSFDSGDIQIFLNNSEGQSVIEDLGWDGGLRHSVGDLLYVTDSNIGWSKSDRNMSRSTEYIVDMSQYPKMFARLKVNYRNYSGPTAAKCEPQWIDRGDKYSELKNACNWNLIRVYIPAGSVINSHRELPLPAGSIAVERMGRTEGDDSFRVEKYDDNVAEVSALIITDAGQESSFDVNYELPNSVVSRNGGCFTYQLEVKKQPGVRYRPTTIKIVLPDDAVVIDGLDQLDIEDNTADISDDLQKNAKVGFVFNIPKFGGCQK